MKSDKLILLGTSHIAKESIHKVEKLLKSEKPEIVALELDKPRLMALLDESKRKGKISFKVLRKIGIKGLIFSWIGEYVEKKLGKLVGTKPGGEMKKAYFIAQEERMRVALIDQDITKTLKKLTKEITWKEKFRFIGDLIMSVVRPRKIPFDLNKVPSDAVIKKLVDEVKKKYPTVHRVLISERNQVMGKRLANLMLNFPQDKIVAVIGAGHEDEIRSIVEQKLLSSKLVEKNINK